MQDGRGRGERRIEAGTAFEIEALDARASARYGRVEVPMATPEALVVLMARSLTQTQHELKEAIRHRDADDIAHGGTIRVESERVESELGRGSCFTLELPLARSD